LGEKENGLLKEIEKLRDRLAENEASIEKRGTEMNKIREKNNELHILN